MSLLLADDVPTSQESMAAEAPVSPLPVEAAAPGPVPGTPEPPHAAAPGTPATGKPLPDAPGTPQLATSKGQDGPEEGKKRALPQVEASPEVEASSKVETSNHSGSGKKGRKRVKASPGVGESPQVPEVITGSYPVLASEQEHLQKAAMLSAKAQEATKKHRLRTKTTPVTTEKKKHRLRTKTTPVTTEKNTTKANTGSATKEARPASATKEARPAAKSRAARGTAGTFCGRRPPNGPEAAAEFAAIRDAYYEMRAESKASKRRGKDPTPCEYLQEMKAIIADLKAQHPGQPSSRWYMQEAHKVRRSRGSGIKSQAKAEDKKAKKSKKGKKDEEEKVEKAEKDEEDKEKVEEKVEEVEEVKVEEVEEVKEEVEEVKVEKVDSEEVEEVKVDGDNESYFELD